MLVGAAEAATTLMRSNGKKRGDMCRTSSGKCEWVTAGAPIMVAIVIAVTVVVVTRIVNAFSAEAINDVADTATGLDLKLMTNLRFQRALVRG